MADELSTGVEQVHRTLVDLGADDLGSPSDDDELRELLVRLEALGSTVQALQARAMVEMRRRAEAEDLRLDARRAERSGSAAGDHGQVAEFVADEVAVLLSCTRVAAARRLSVALDAVGHAELMDAWLQGRIDLRKVEEIVRCVAPLDEPGSLGILAIAPLVSAGVRYAEAHTASQVRAWLGRRVIAAVPEAAERRRARALGDRRVTFELAHDGLAELTALLPAVQARQIYETVNCIAHEGTAPDARSMDQRRADALVDLVVGRAEPPQVALQVVVPADVLAGESDEPGWMAGVGPVTAATVREMAGASQDGRTTDITLRRLVCDPVSGVLTDVGGRRYRPPVALDRAVRTRDVTCRFPGCRRSALGGGTGTDLDHLVPWPTGGTRASNLAVLCRRHHRLKHSPGWVVTAESGGRLVWTTPTGRQFVTEPWQYVDPPVT